MPDIGITVTGDRELALKFDQFPLQAHDRLRDKIETLTEELYEAVEAIEPRRTGKLAGETREGVRDQPDRISGRVGITAEFGKAAALDFGASGSTEVRAHEARLAQVYGRVVPGLSVHVGAHTRRLDIPARHFLEKPLDEMHDEIVDGLRQALEEAIDA